MSQIVNFAVIMRKIPIDVGLMTIIFPNGLNGAINFGINKDEE